MTQATRVWLEKNSYDPTNLDLQGSYANTALMKAAREGDATIVKELLEAGADGTLKNPDDFSALDLAVTPKILKMIRSSLLK